MTRTITKHDTVLVFWRNIMPKRVEYDVLCIDTAITDIRINSLSLRAAAKKYGIPKSTLEFKLKHPGHKTTCGPSPILNGEEELELVK